MSARVTRATARIATPVLAALALGAAAPEAYQSSPPRTPAPEPHFTGPLAGYRAFLTPRLMRDFGERDLYAAADRALGPPALGEARVVFLGDSITDRWDLAKSFPGRPYVNRGIGGQVTAQMLVRLRQDVLALHPRAVFILGGTNDLGGVLQVDTDAGIEGNLQSIAELARAHGVRVVLASITPVNSYTANARDMVRDHPPARIAAVNRWMRAYARACGAGYADLGPALSDRDGRLRREFTDDGLHPNALGYAAMAPVVARELAAALAAPPGPPDAACADAVPARP